MTVAEKKFGEILPYMVKRGAKIVFAKTSKEDKAFVKARKKAYKAAQKPKKD